MAASTLSNPRMSQAYGGAGGAEEMIGGKRSKKTCKVKTLEQSIWKMSANASSKFLNVFRPITLSQG